MKRSYLFGIAFTICLAGPLQAQTLSEGFSEQLAEQGFVVLSKRYTWLGRVVVYVSNGDYEREILITRSSSQILQDNWTKIETDTETSPAIKPVISGREASRGPGGPSGPDGPSGPGGPGGPGGQGSPGGQP